MNRRNILATDLDGTFIPLDDVRQNVSDLATLVSTLQTTDTQVVFVTGRHFESVMRAIETFSLPTPSYIICDVGTSIYEKQPSGDFQLADAYASHLSQITESLPIAELRSTLANVSGLQLQEETKQGRFKLSYYANADVLPKLVANVSETLKQFDAPYSIIHSVDPFNGDGLLDLLPRGVSKAHALNWWCNDVDVDETSLIFAGDSGNDLAAMSSGYRTIVVGNAARSLARRVSVIHKTQGWNDRLYLAINHATSGVLEGCRWFGLH